MSLVEIKLPLDSVSRLVSAAERLATAAESIAAYLCPSIPTPEYTRNKSHISTPNFALIHDVEELNADRVRRGLNPLTAEQAARVLRNEIESD